jgi:hypothetical protein
MKLASRFSLISLSLLAGLLQADSLPLTPGSILLGHPGFPTGTVSEVTTTGSPIATLALPVLGDIPESLTVLNGQLFVGDGSGEVSRINPVTGSVLASFQTPNIALTSLGDYNGNLIALPSISVVGPTPKTVYVYSTAGSLLQSITLQTSPSNVAWNGLTSDGTNLYLADYTSGNIFEYSTAGALLASIQTNIGAGLTGVSYDASNNSLWVSNGITHMAYDLSTSGSLLSDFATGSNFEGIAVVPGIATPEPNSFALIGLTLSTALAGMLRRQYKPE